MMDLDELPDDVILLILHQFTFLDRVRCLQLVSKRWQRLCQSGELLEKLDAAQVRFAVEDETRTQ
jgi:hypothetical protein